MTNQEWIDMLCLIPESEHSKLVVMLSSGSEITVDTLHRLDTHFIALRGRLSGTIDEARAFLVPYSNLVCVRIERTVKLEELDAIFGANPAAPASTPNKVAPQISPLAIPHLSEPPENKLMPVHPGLPTTDPATASRLLLERIRVARATHITKSTN